MLRRSLQVSYGLLQVGTGAMSLLQGPLQVVAGAMSGCNDENTAKHAPLQRNNAAGQFCNDAEWLSNASWLHGDGLLPGCVCAFHLTAIETIVDQDVNF